MSVDLQHTYQRLRDEIGREHIERLGAIAGRDLERFAVASDVPDAGGGICGPGGQRVAPPLFLSSVMGWGPGAPEAALATDGTSAEETRGLPLPGVRLMGAGQDLEFHAPVPEGVKVLAHTSLADVQLKRGTSGTLLIMQVLRRFTDEDGRPLVTCRESFIAR